MYFTTCLFLSSEDAPLTKKKERLVSLEKEQSRLESLGWEVDIVNHPQHHDAKFRISKELTCSDQCIGILNGVHLLGEIHCQTFELLFLDVDPVQSPIPGGWKKNKNVTGCRIRHSIQYMSRRRMLKIVCGSCLSLGRNRERELGKLVEYYLGYIRARRQ